MIVKCVKEFRCFAVPYNSWNKFLLGDLTEEDDVLEFLTSLEAMDLPDRIEEVNSRILEKIVQETEFVAVLFCK